MAQSTVETKNKKDFNNGKIPAKETILSPRFYTTDFEAMENMDLSITRRNWKLYVRNLGKTIIGIIL